MYKLLYISILSFVISFNTAAQGCMNLVWSDEFDTNGAPNPNVWGYDLGAGGYGNNEIQNYTNNAENVRIENGILIIEAKKGATGWTSARLKSTGKKSFTYGRIEFRAKLPAGSGTWPALWMLGESVNSVGWPACGEIDIMEHVGKDPGKVHASIHTPSSYGATQNTGITTVSSFSTDFHIYALEWTPDKMDFYVDNTLYYTYAPAVKNDQTWPFDKPAFIIMNVAMGGNWGSDSKYESGGLKNGIDPNLTSVRMEVDYVRYYNTNAKPTITGSTLINENQETTFSVPSNSGTNYQWTVPSDAQVIAGQGTSAINVKWGTSSGNVSLSLDATCGVVNASPLMVRVKKLPTDATYHVPIINNNTIIWEVIPTPDNSISLSNTSDWQIDYTINEPNNLPRLRYDFKSIVNLSNYKYIGLSLKTESSNPPSVVRLDMLDMNGNNNQDNLFKITDFATDNAYHTYVGSIASGSIFDLGSVQQLIMYINYGLYGQKGSGKFWINDVFFSTSNPLSTRFISQTDSYFKIYPNPATHFLRITAPEEISSVSLFNSLGKQMNVPLNYGEMNVDGLVPGIYFLQVKDKKGQIHSLTFSRK